MTKETESWDGELSARQRQILNLVVSHYIKTGEPVGSRTLVKTYRLPLGPATIRNEMADLEELGYLEHPHTSAGRVPTDKGYRAYVTTLEEPSLTPAEEDGVHKLADDYLRSNIEFQQILGSSIRLLADVTKMMSIAASPQFGQSHIEKIHLVDIGHNRVLVVLATRSGRVETVTLDITSGIPPEILGKMSETLNRCFNEHSVQEFIDGYHEVVGEIRRVYRDSVKDLLDKFLATIHGRLEDRLLIEGALQVVNLPEFKSMQEGQEFLGGQRYKNELMTLLKEEGSGSRSRVVIGEETGNPAMNDLTLVMAKYDAGDDQKGTIGIIGPRRMNYRKTIASVDQIAKILTKKLTAGKPV